MKTHELRIGNTILYKGIIHHVSILTLSALSRDNVLGGEEYSPIPLTEEWLLKLGFEFDELYGIKKLYLESGAIFQLGGIGGNNIMYYKGKLEEYWADVLKEINYIHELQNLIYSLTGEELTIKM